MHNLFNLEEQYLIQFYTRILSIILSCFEIIRFNYIGLKFKFNWYRESLQIHMDNL